MQRRQRIIRPSHPRRGSLYITVLITASIVSLLAMSALMVQRIQRQAYIGQSDQIEARLNAETAGRLCLLKIDEDPNWRFTSPNGDWETDTVFGNGTYTINVVDPTDGDLSDSPNDPVTITGIGKVGSAIQKVQFSINTSIQPTPTLESTMHAGQHLVVNSAELAGSGTVTANGDSTVSVSDVAHDVNVAGWIYGATYSGSYSYQNPGIDMPSNVFSFYTTNGTQMDITDIVTGPPPSPPVPVTPPNKISSGDFESGIAPWSPWPTGTAVVTTSAAAAKNGSYGCSVTNRLSTFEGATVDVTSLLQSGTPYDFSLWFRSASACDVSVTIKLESTGSGTTYANDSWDPAGTSWTKLNYTIVPEWTGNLTLATLYIEANHTLDYEIDDFQMLEPSEASLPAGSNLLNEGNMELTPFLYWYATNGAVLELSTIKHAGLYSMRVRSRSALEDSVAQNVTSSIENGATYHAEAWLRYSNIRSTCRLSLRVKTDTADTIVPLSPWREAPGNKFVKCYGQATVSWTGTLELAEFFVETLDNTNDSIRLDDAVLIEVAPGPPPPHTIYRVVLSPNNNPYGPTNPDGIYVIECMNQDIYIQDSRIVGTLVLQNPGPNSKLLKGGIDWEPAHSNYPCLLVDGSNFIIEGDTAGLNETALEKNYNPVGTPSPYAGGVEDSDTTDTWVSSIKGLIYSSTELTFTGSPPVIDGNVIAGNDITVENGLTTVNDTSIHRVNPPPGFFANPEVELIRKSMSRAYDN